MEKTLFPTDSLLSISGLKYREGAPRSYRYNASDGNFNLDGETIITKKGQPFSFVPFAYRKFTAQIFGQHRRKWVEFFFANQAGHICACLFHGYSVRNLERLEGQIFYDDLLVMDCKLTATPEARQNSQTGTTYFICSWSYEPLSDEERTAAETIRNNFVLYREDSLSLDTSIIMSVGYNQDALFNLQHSRIEEAEVTETEA